MKNEQALEVIKEQSRMYISNPERAAEALLFVKNLKRFAEELEDKVKQRAVELMDDKQVEVIHYSVTDPESGEVREWEAKRSYGTVTKEYRPENVLGAIGVAAATPFLKVSKLGLENFLKRKSALGEITMDVVEKALANPVEKTRKGAGVILREIKATAVLE